MRASAPVQRREDREPPVRVPPTAASAGEVQLMPEGTPTELMSVGERVRSGLSGLACFAGLEPVQRRASGEERADHVQRVAAQGVRGSGGALPYLDRIQASFGRHDVSAVQAHVGGAAAQAASAIGARAYATGNDVAFAGSPDLHTAAHEAAHVVQQRAGVQLKGGVGQAGDKYERHADAVADLVVQGKSAEGLLDTMAGGSGGGGVQRAVQLDVGASDVARAAIWLANAPVNVAKETAKLVVPDEHHDDIDETVDKANLFKGGKIKVSNGDNSFEVGLSKEGDDIKSVTFKRKLFGKTLGLPASPVYGSIGFEGGLLGSPGAGGGSGTVGVALTGKMSGGVGTIDKDGSNEAGLSISGSLVGQSAVSVSREGAGYVLASHTGTISLIASVGLVGKVQGIGLGISKELDRYTIASYSLGSVSLDANYRPVGEVGVTVTLHMAELQRLKRDALSRHPAGSLVDAATDDVDAEDVSVGYGYQFGGGAGGAKGHGTDGWEAGRLGNKYPPVTKRGGEARYFDWSSLIVPAQKAAGAAAGMCNGMKTSGREAEMRPAAKQLWSDGFAAYDRGRRLHARYQRNKAAQDSVGQQAKAAFDDARRLFLEGNRAQGYGGPAG